MPLFWSLIALLLITTLGMLLWPLLRRPHAWPASDPDVAAIAVYRDQRRQLDAEHAAGTITAAERDMSLAELARRVAQEVPDGSAKAIAASTPRATWPIAVALLVLVPLAAILIYARLGNPGAMILAEAEKSNELADPQIMTMVDNLAGRLKDRPDDAQGWLLLARSYRTLGRFANAADAYARVDVLVPDNADLLADYADMLAMAQGQRLAGKPTELVRRALAIEPQHKKGLALAATAALEIGDLDGALKYWRELQTQWPPGSAEVQQIAAFIAETEEAKRNPLPSVTARVKPGTRSTRQSSSMSARRESTGMTVSGRVELNSSLAPKVALNDTVFIFARAAEGPRMPVAILRIAAKELPRDFALDDSMAMTPAATVSRTPQIVVEARISNSGNALPQPGDLFGKSAVVKPGASGLRITIDQVVP
jgi:cytochrome c-type biogenesis protein CcmH